MRRLAIYLSLLFLFSVPIEGVVILPGLVTLTKLLGFILTGFWLLTALHTGYIRRPHPFHVVMLMFVLWNALTIYWTFDTNRTVERVETYGQLFLLSLIVWDLYLTRRSLRAGMQAYVLGAYVTTSYVIRDFLTREAMNGRYGTGRDFNEVSLILAIGIPLAWYLAISSETRGRNPLRVANMLYVPIAYFGILLSASRGGLLASIPGLLFVVMSMTNLKRFQRVFVFVLLIASALLIQSIVPEQSIARLSETSSSISEGDLTGRGEIWKQGFETFLEHPLVGVGSGAFREAIDLGKAPHNVFLSILVDTGVIGFLLFVTLLLIAYRQAWIQPKLESRLWLSTLLMLTIGIISINWEHRKPTWLLLTFVIVSAHVIPDTVYRAMSVGSYAPHRLPESAFSEADPV